MFALDMNLANSADVLFAGEPKPAISIFLQASSWQG